MSYTTHADFGGQVGHGAVVPEPKGELFHAEWEPAALALALAMGATGSWNIDMSRAARETLPDYERLSYYRIWTPPSKNSCSNEARSERRTGGRST